MVAIRLRYLLILVLVCIFLLGVGIAATLNADFGSLDVKVISIPNQGQRMSGLLYRPHHATAENPLPAVVLAHGISNAKETVSGIALELARRGFVALAIDEVGHGNSEGRIGDSDNDPTLGTLVAVRYLESQSFVDASSIGLVGHSLGAGAILATAVAHGNITASVFIGGGVGGADTDPAYGKVNTTFPKNLLIAIGKYDVLFDIDQLRTGSLPRIFGTSQEIIVGSLYGDFSSQTARKLVTPATTHLFEPLDPAIVSEIVSWMDNAFNSGSSNQNRLPERNLIYLYREGAIFASVIAFVGFVFPIPLAILDLPHFAAHKKESKTKYRVLDEGKALVIWGLLGVVLYLPMLVAGSFVPIPPLVFGSSIAWWLLAVAFFGSLSILFLAPKFSTIKVDLKSVVSEAFDRHGVMISVGMFAFLYLIANLVELLFVVNLRIVVPLFSDLMPITRVLMFIMFLPFFLVYFFVEGLYLHELHACSVQKPGFRSEALAMSRVIGIKIIPYVAFLCVQYIPMLVLGVQPFPGFLGFLVEFHWALVPLFVISTACSWWFYRNTSTIGMGVTFNSLLFSWIAATLFPFGTNCMYKLFLPAVLVVLAAAVALILLPSLWKISSKIKARASYPMGDKRSSSLATATR